MTDCVCADCGHKQESAEWREECPVCHEGTLDEVWLECECGKAYCERDVERAQDDAHYEKHMADRTITQNEEWDWLWEESPAMLSYAWDTYPHQEWEDAWEGYAWSGGVKPVVEPSLKYVCSSEQRWCYGSDSWNWTEVYECTCGAHLHFESGT